MTFPTRAIAALALALGLTSTGAFGQDQHILEMEQDMEDRTTYETFGRSFDEAGLFDRYDVDRDGILTREEFNRGVFTSYDRDLDDYLNTEEAEQLIDEWDAPVRAGLHGTEQDSADPGAN